MDGLFLSCGGREVKREGQVFVLDICCSAVRRCWVLLWFGVCVLESRD